MVEQYKKELMQYQRLQPQSIERGAPAPSGAKTASSSEAVPVLRQQPPDPPSSSTPSAQPAASSPLPADPAPRANVRLPTSSWPSSTFKNRLLPLPPQPPPPAPAPVQQQQAPARPLSRSRRPAPRPKGAPALPAGLRAMEAGVKCLPPPPFLPLAGRISSWTCGNRPPPPSGLLHRNRMRGVSEVRSQGRGGQRAVGRHFGTAAGAGTDPAVFTAN